MTAIRFDRTFCAAHRLWQDDSPCRNIHGHNYRVTVSIATDGDLTDSGFIVPFDAIKAIIDANDHRLILDRDDPLLGQLGGSDLALRLTKGPPSTELLAGALAAEIMAALDEERLPQVELSVTLRETDGIEARAYVSR